MELQNRGKTDFEIFSRETEDTEGDDIEQSSSSSRFVLFFCLSDIWLDQ